MMLGGFIGYSVGSTILKGEITEIKIQKHINDTINAHARRDLLLPAVIDATLEVCVRGPPDGEVPLEEVVFQWLRVILRRRLGQLLSLSHQTLDGCNYFVNAVMCIVTLESNPKSTYSIHFCFLAYPAIFYYIVLPLQ